MSIFDRISLSEEELVKLRAYNGRRDIHCEYVHPEHTRYSHEYKDNFVIHKYHCGFKNPEDTKECRICMLKTFNLTEKETYEFCEGNSETRNKLIQKYNIQNCCDSCYQFRYSNKRKEQCGHIICHFCSEGYYPKCPICQNKYKNYNFFLDKTIY